MMGSSAAVEMDTIWLRSAGHTVVPLNKKVAPRAPELARALKEGVPAYPDGSRPDFYDVELSSGWAYIHVHDSRQVIYLVACIAR